MMQIRRSADRGQANHGWLDTRFTFSFADYYNPEQMGFRALRVINEDRIAGGTGFPRHPHAEMEIVSYVVEGQLEHTDSQGNRSTLGAGGVQRMSAGTGITHSEKNPSSTDATHLLQIWLQPGQAGLAPSWEERVFAPEEKRGRWRRLVSPRPADGELAIHQDVELFATLLDTNDELVHPIGPGRHAWLQLIRGAIEVNGERVEAGDGVALSDEAALTIRALEPSEAILFDLA